MSTIDSYIEPIRTLLSEVEKQTRLLGTEKLKALYPPGTTIDHEVSEQFESLIAAMESEIVLSEELSYKDKKYWYGYVRSFKAIWAKYSDPVYYRAMIIIDTVVEYLDSSNPRELQTFGLKEGMWELECLVREYGGEWWTSRFPKYEVSPIFEFIFERLDYYSEFRTIEEQQYHFDG